MYHPRVAKHKGEWTVLWHGMGVRVSKVEASRIAWKLDEVGVPFNVDPLHTTSGERFGQNLDLTDHDDECLEVWF